MPLGRPVFACRKELRAVSCSTATSSFLGLEGASALRVVHHTPGFVISALRWFAREAGMLSIVVAAALPSAGRAMRVDMRRSFTS